MSCRTRVGCWIRDAPVDEPPNGIVGAGHRPRRSGRSIYGRAAPGLVALGIVRSSDGIEPPGFFPGFCVIGADVTAWAPGGATASRQYFAFDNNGSRRVTSRIR